jgi:hypothetical protein
VFSRYNRYFAASNDPDPRWVYRGLGLICARKNN